MTTPHRIWIELEQPKDDSEGRHRAALASSMLLRLGVKGGGGSPPVWWDERRQQYAFTIDGAGSYVNADDRGHWYNLDFLGRPQTADANG